MFSAFALFYYIYLPAIFLLNEYTNVIRWYVGLTVRGNRII